MHYSLFLNCEYSAGTDLRERVEDHVKQAELAQQLGFTGVAVGQHLSIGSLQWFPPIPFLSHLTARCPDLHVATAVVVLPYHNPTLLAESLAFLDVLTDGKLSIGLAPGWAADEFGALGVDHESRLERFDSGVRMVTSLLAGESVAAPGDGGQEFRLGLLPVQRPRPPIWLGGSSVKIARELAHLGDTMVMSSHVPLDKLVKVKKAFVEAKGGETYPLPTTPVLRNVFVGKTREAALEVAMPFLEASYSNLDDWGLFQKVLHEPNTSERFGELVLNRVILGDPDDVAEGLRLVGERLDTDHVILRMQWLGLGQEHVEESLRTFGDSVMPNV